MDRCIFQSCSPQKGTASQNKCKENAQAREVCATPTIGKPPGDVAGARKQSKAPHTITDQEQDEGPLLIDQIQIPCWESITSVWPWSKEKKTSWDGCKKNHDQTHWQKQQWNRCRDRLLFCSHLGRWRSHEDVTCEEPSHNIAHHFKCSQTNSILTHVRLDGHHEIKDQEQEWSRCHHAM